MRTSGRFFLLAVAVLGLFSGFAKQAYAADGSVWAWGHNSCGQLGNATDSGCASDVFHQAAPVQVIGLNDVVAVEGGLTHSIALRSDGTVWSWGRNEFKALGNGSREMLSNVPVQTRNLGNVVAVAAAVEFSLALRSDGTVWAWGINTSSVLAEPYPVPYESLPVQIQGLGNVVAIAASGYSAMALRGDGTVWCWGSNGKGQLGDGSSVSDSAAPVMVRNLANVVAIAAGYNFKAALRTDGTVWAWGEKLICGTAENSNVPVQIAGISDVVSIVAGDSHIIARKSNGTVWSWGADTNCKLGNSTCTNKNTPTEVVAVSGAIAFAPGAYHSVALKPDGTVWAWGWNVVGELGDGTETDRRTAVQAIGLDGVTRIGAGDMHTLAAKGNISHSATLYDGLHIHIPVLNVLGYPLSVDLEYVPSTDANLLFRFIGSGSAFPDPNGAIVLVRSNTILLHIPSLLIEPYSLWCNLEYVPSNDGNLWFRLQSIGQN
jgi:alpha-tubulin suppressor-like RCC1 family protein